MLLTSSHPFLNVKGKIMQDLQKLVAEFHNTFGHPCHETVNFRALCNEKLGNLRLNLIREEAQEGFMAETAESLESDMSTAIVEMFDAVVDVAVVTFGTGLVFGLKLDSVDLKGEVSKPFTGFAPLLIMADQLEEALKTLRLNAKTQSYLAASVSRILQDIINYCFELAHSCGFPFEEGFLEVHRSNMSKLGEGGLPVYRHDGKILKGPNYFKPNLASLLNENLGL